MKSFTKSDQDKVFILSGYAGTGKTTLLKAFTEWLDSEHYVNAATNSMLRNLDRKKFIPMASTGRAAKVLRDKIGQGATTVHSTIYFYTSIPQPY